LVYGRLVALARVTDFFIELRTAAASLIVTEVFLKNKELSKGLPWSTTLDASVAAVNNCNGSASSTSELDKR